MAKALVFKTVNSDVQNRLKEFEKLRIKLKSEIVKAANKKDPASKDNKGILKSISEFFTDSNPKQGKTIAKK